MTKTKLEKVLEHLINDDEDAAKALLHDVFIDAARDIHESLIAEDDLDDEDLGDLPMGDVEGEEDMGDMDMDMDGEGEAEEEIVDDLGDEESEDEDLEDRIEDLEAQLEKLQSEFEELAAIEDEEHGEEYSYDDEDGEEAGDEDLDLGDEDEAGDDEEVEAGDDEEAEEETDDVEESVEWDDDDFLSLDEGVLDDLQDVNVKMSDGEIGAGGSIKQNNDSPVVSKKPGERAGGKAVEVKSTEHSGYEREKAPSTQDGTGASKPTNVRSKHTAGNSKVAKDGDSKASLNSGEGFGEEGKDSPIGSREMR